MASDRTSRPAPAQRRGRSPAGGALAPFETVVHSEGPVVWRVCRALLAADDAEDAWAETFLAALRAYPSLTPGSNVRGWLVTIAHRKALDQLRAARRRAEPRAEPATGGFRPHDGSAPGAFDGPSAGRDAHGGLEQLEDEELRAAVAALPDKARRAVVYRYLADLAYPEVAALLGTSEAAARRNASDGIAKLRRGRTPKADRQHGADPDHPSRTPNEHTMEIRR